MEIGKLSSLLNAGSFSRKLEGFLTSDTSGKKTMYRDVPEGLVQRDRLIRSNIDAGGIQTLKNYSGYYTAFAYNDRARFVNGVSNVVNTLSTILKKDTVA